MNILILPENGKAIGNGQTKEITSTNQLGTREKSLDTTQPTVVKTSPSDGASAITNISKITATFS